MNINRSLDTQLKYIKGVGDKTALLFARLKVKTIRDLLEYYPRRYNDYSNLSTIDSLEPGEVSLKAKVERTSGRYVRRGMHVTEAVLNDGSGKLKAVWFNQPYLAKSIPKGEDLFFAGNYQLSHTNVSLLNPVWEKVSEFQKNTARIVPVYKETKGLTSKQIRKVVLECLDLASEVKNILPESVSYLKKPEVIKQMHFPETKKKLMDAKKALGFEELFVLIAASQLLRREHRSFTSEQIGYNDEHTQKFLKQLGFELTKVQKTAAWQIIKDIDSTNPMNRLLQGDVGSGKTAVAAMACLQALAAGGQVAIVAPTEILASQHTKSFAKLFNGFNFKQAPLTGSLSKVKKAQTIKEIESGLVQIVVGTHALFEDNIKFKNLNLIVIDEQHRFGVKQRQKLQKTSKFFPHLLSMSATPIPRSLALTVYGDLDVSVLNEMPPGRQPIKTKIVRQSSRLQTYTEIDEQITAGSQVYVVCPLVEDSDTLGVKSAEAEYRRLSKTIFSHRKIGLLHGRLKPTEKDEVMQSFSQGKLDILISTTVVEVGVDVANATIMMIEGAERFGLAQLHQLRGRVGRGHKQSFCYLLPTSDENIGTRLRAMQTSNSGFKLAELDLKLRGPGAVYGRRQHGQLDLRFAEITDTKLISEVQDKVKHFLDTQDLNQYPELMKKIIAARTVTKLN